MPPLNLSVTFLGRPVKPVSFGIAMLSVALFISNVVTNTGLQGYSVYGDVLGGVALLSFFFLCLGWIRSSQYLAEIGLLFAACCYTIRGVYVALTLGISAQALWYSIAIALIAGGSFFLERSDHVTKTGGR